MLLLVAADIIVPLCFAALNLQQFQEHHCGDGTPSGIYSSSERNVPNLDHVIVFQGGGACWSDDDCLDKIEKTPEKFSSRNYPQTIKGEMILSEYASENVDGLENAAKWFVPYCSQDGYLGVETDVLKDGSQLPRRTGSLQFAQAIRHWASNAIRPSRLVVVGISIGAMGVLNHLQELESAASSAGLKMTDLVIILDSGILSAHHIGLDSATASYISSLTSRTMHPLCYEKNMGLGSLLGKSLPCCLSLTCMLARNQDTL